MKQPLFIKNSPIDEKRISFIETLICRLFRRVHKTTTVIIPAQLISKHICKPDIRCEIIKLMFFKGFISKVLLHIDIKPKRPINIDIRVRNDNTGYSKSYAISDITSNINLDVDTIDGSIMTISIFPESSEDIVNEIWISMLWTPEVSRSKMEEFAISDLENLAGANLLGE